MTREHAEKQLLAELETAIGHKLDQLKGGEVLPALGIADATMFQQWTIEAAYAALRSLKLSGKRLTPKKRKESY
jgi:hypothetical protein